MFFSACFYFTTFITTLQDVDNCDIIILTSPCPPKTTMAKINTNQLWRNVIDELKVTVSEATFKTFFSRTSLISLENNIATIGCLNQYFCEQTELRYYSLVKDVLDRQTKQNNSLVFTVTRNTRHETRDIKKMGPLFQSETQKKIQPKITFDPTTGLHPRYTLETFVVGNSNNFAHAAAQGIVKKPGTTYNPFFVWGGVGVGKTHLIQAIGHEISKTHPEFKVLYCEAESFGNELVAALQNKSMPRFKRKFRSLDVFLVDDVQFIAGKEYIQDEFFHTFNKLHMGEKQIVLTSDRRPENLAGMEERLVSRFAGGLAVDIQLPDFETRVAIVKQKCQEKEVDLTEEAIQLLAQTIESNVRDLEGNLTQILSRASGEEVSLEFVQNFFGIKEKATRKKVSSRKIVSVVGKYFKLKHKELVGPRRLAKIALARQIAMYFLRKELDLPLTQVADILGRKDHTTIIHGVDKIARQFSTNLNLRRDVSAIREKIYS